MKNETKHTKGEWIVGNGSIFCNGELVAMSATLLNRVDETRESGESWLSMRNRTQSIRIECENEKEANAKLIAAAPDLLEACIIALKYFNGFDTESQDEAAFHALNNAINKATK